MRSETLAPACTSAPPSPSAPPSTTSSPTTASCGAPTTATERVGYVVKVYPRFSETFVVTEVLAREAQGEELEIFALRPTTDTHFHPALARVHAPVTYLPRALKASEMWASIARAHDVLPDLGPRLAEVLPLTTRLAADEVAQGVELAIAVRTRGITRLHAHFASAQARVAAVAAHLAQVPWSVTTHAKDIFHDEVDLDLLADLLHGASTVVAISAYNERHLGRVAPRARVARVANGLDLTGFGYREPKPVAGPLRVLAVGRLVEKKGFDVLLDALATARAAGLEVRAEVAGSGELGPDLLAHTRSLGLDDVVTWLGARPQDEVLALLRQADVFVAPCVVGADGNADGLPTVILEAMAVGTPVISTAVTGIPEVVRGTVADPVTGVLLEPGDPGALADALRAVAADAFPRADVARRARDLVERDHDTTRQAALLARSTGAVA
ncbi:glycosyltransferase family 4 protein [Janibacter melonis]|uniref:glycosyltransferase family 4 protein n=1 Tax=Janibacter melonis TaxID=262209 RepID=UPI00191A3944|nr:glycosyltransferase family 4 protein [Janibacter melonis]